jgi:hypothetical protein
MRTALAVAIVVAAAAWVCVDLARDTSSYGTHDWDVMEAFRHLARLTILRFGQFPFWDPYGCGGFPYWAGPESGTTIISPMLPVYLWLPLTVALRVEVAFALAIGLTGAWMLAGRFAADPILRAAVCVVAILNSRWALQAAAGHTWHLYYGLLPWALWAFMGALEGAGAARARWIVTAGALLALMVYTGAIYPLPHALLAIALYAAYFAYREKSRDPLVLAALAGMLAFALAAPKLLPMLDTMARFPRTVPSREWIDPIAYARMFTSTEADRVRWPFWEHEYGYHEYGIYLGVLGSAALAYGVSRPPADDRARAIRALGVVYFLLSFGVFGPWAILHLVPPFRSQHVPTRFLYPATLFFSLAAAAAYDRKMAGSRRAAAAAVAVTVFLSATIARESRACLAHGFGIRLAAAPERTVFEQSFDVPAELSYPESNGPSSAAVHLVGTGAILCSSFHGFNQDAWKQAKGRPPRLGARGRGEPEYRGEVYVDGAEGSAVFASWTPNAMSVRTAAPAGALVVLNQNWDESWTANGAPTIAHHGVNAYRLAERDEQVLFRYRPRTLPWGLGIAFLAAVASLWGCVWRRAP